MDWKTKILLFYVLCGSLIGLLAGAVTINNAVKKEEEVVLSPKEGAKLGIAAIDAMKKLILN